MAVRLAIWSFRYDDKVVAQERYALITSYLTQQAAGSQEVRVLGVFLRDDFVAVAGVLDEPTAATVGSAPWGSGAQEDLPFGVFDELAAIVGATPDLPRIHYRPAPPGEQDRRAG